MIREPALKVALVIVGLLFSASIYPLFVFGRHQPALAMMLSVYATLGVFLLLAARNPGGNRTLIAFTAWSSLVHAAVMVVQVSLKMIERQELFGVVLFGIIGIAFIALAPPRSAVGRASAPGA